MERVLVTGADGFIGKNLVYALLKEGIEVYAIVYPGNNIYTECDNEKLYVKCLDLNQVMNHVREFPSDIDVMYHFAWMGVRPEYRNNLDVQMINVNMTLDCMKLAIAIGIKKIVFPGSTNEYLYYGKPLNKDAVPSPSNAYGAAKIALRYLCSDYATRNNIEFVYAIIAGIYAADRRDNNVIFYTIDKLLKKEKPLLTKLEQLWDYIYVDDVIAALTAIGKKGKGGAVYAIGHGDNWALSNYIKIIHKKIDSSLPLGIGEVPYVSEKLPSSCIDLTDIERDTGFKPQVDFEEGITKVIDKIRYEREKNIE
ncbi:dTDP-6-deoxy-L-talose 4-dehydrogenase (NAD(+)) [Lachnospiraceae bacterium]|nr:dTDP-6-deoxy-L-talose 4-dehydrogenase (NAD(+)) [Lachnospiraceae bacterium]